MKSCNEDTRSYVHQITGAIFHEEDVCIFCFITVRRNELLQKAYCGYPAAIDRCCSHVAATLVALEEFCKLRAKQEETRSLHIQKIQVECAKKAQA